METAFGDPPKALFEGVTCQSFGGWTTEMVQGVGGWKRSEVRRMEGVASRVFALEGTEWGVGSVMVGSVFSGHPDFHSRSPDFQSGSPPNPYFEGVLERSGAKICAAAQTQIASPTLLFLTFKKKLKTGETLKLSKLSLFSGSIAPKRPNRHRKP